MCRVISAPEITQVADYSFFIDSTSSHPYPITITQCQDLPYTLINTKADSTALPIWISYAPDTWTFLSNDNQYKGLTDILMSATTDACNAGTDCTWEMQF